MVWAGAESVGGQPLICWCDDVSERKPYPSDLSDEQWALIEPVITAWKARHRSVSGHQGAYAMREIVNAIVYQGRTTARTWTTVAAATSSPGPSRTASNTTVHELRPGSSAMTIEYGQPGTIWCLPSPRP